MQTIKTGIVVALLLTICYGAYVAINAPEVELPEDLQQWADQNGRDVIPNFEIPEITPTDGLGMFAEEKQANSPTQTISPAFPEVNLAAPAQSASGQMIASTPVGSVAEPPAFPPISSPLTSANAPASNAAASFPTLQASPENQPNPSATTLGDFLDPALTSSSGPSIAFSPDFPPTNSSGPLLENNDLSSLPEFSDTGLTGDSLATDLINAGASDTTALPLLTSIDLSNNSTPVGSTGNEVNLPEAKSNPPAQPFAAAKSQALELAAQSKLREALELMTLYYESPELGYAEHTDLVDLLDALSREVIYSNRHLINSPYSVSAQDTLESLAAQYKLNPELLAAINQMGDTRALVPNTQIKVLEGPFHAQVSLARGELTIFLKKMYAGRFPVSISTKNRPPVGRYEIVDRRTDRIYYGANLRIPPQDPTNPFGGFWLSLGGEWAIHGSPEQITSDLESAGCISLAPLDAADVYRILAKGCAVEIRP